MKDLLAGVDEWCGAACRSAEAGDHRRQRRRILTTGRSPRPTASPPRCRSARLRLVELWYTADFSQFQPTWFRGAPWEDPKDYAARSPITFIDKVKTPLMLIEGETDYRTPPTAGGEQMFRALKYLKRPVVMIRFPGESHELSRSGKPWHRVERLQHSVAWFDKYLQGMKIDTYDVP